MKPYLLEQVKELDPELKLSLKNCIKVLKDKEIHEVYEFHEKYKLNPLLVFKSVSFLIENNIVVVNDNYIQLANDLNNQKVALLNLLMKTSKPNILLKVRF